MSSINLSVTGAADAGGGASGWSIVSPFPCENAAEPSGATSDTLVVSFAVTGGGLPSNATVTGWQVSISRDAVSGGNVWDVSVTSSVGGSSSPSNYAATSTLWPATTGAASYGTGTTDLWGAGSAPSYSNVNSSGATVSLSIKTDGTAGVGYVRNMGLTVYYTTAPNQVIPHAIVMRPTYVERD